MSSLQDFHPIVRTWFTRTYGEPSPPQELGWPHISAGENTLILAPTGSGKTLAAFLWAINHLVEQKLEGPIEPGVRILYVSPLKALNNDIERNLEAPLRGTGAWLAPPAASRIAAPFGSRLARGDVGGAFDKRQPPR